MFLETALDIKIFAQLGFEVIFSLAEYTYGQKEICDDIFGVMILPSVDKNFIILYILGQISFCPSADSIKPTITSLCN